MPQFDLTQILPQLPWLAGVFFLLFLLSWFTLPKVNRAVENRRDTIAADLRAAEAARDEAVDATSGGDSDLENARTEALRKTSAAREQAAGTLSRRLAEVEARLEREVAEAEASLAAARSEVMGELRTAATGAVVDLVKRVGGVDVSEDAAQHAIERAVA